ncbi:MAG: hypothetical protein J6Y92_11565 [Lentisphaeria bacterium]|nr:hypothetical protein [Lentisphaeria bacterium]
MKDNNLLPTPTVDSQETTAPAFWRSVTDADVRQAISGSYLGTICHVLEKNYTPSAPLPLILLQSMLLMSVALTHKHDYLMDEENGEWDEQPSLLCDGPEESFELAPAHLSRLYINTGLGNVPNIYALIVAPSGAGKGLGNLHLIKSLGYVEVTNGSSLEGVKDAAIMNPHVLISLQEFGLLLQGKGYKDTFKKGLTDMFNAGCFTDALSARSRKEVRTVEWFYSSVYASVQPEVLRAAGRSLDIAQGIFSRFLIGYLSPQDAEYDFNPCNPDQLRDLQKLQIGLCRISTLAGVVQVPNAHYNTDFSGPIRPLIDKRMIPVLLRYANEYLPRIALMLAIPSTVGDVVELPELTDDHFQRATTVLHRILTMAEAALGSLTDLEGRSRLQEENLGKMARLLKRLSIKNPRITMADISRCSSGTGWDSKTREGLLNEMIQRGWIDVSHPTLEGVEKVVKGCSITLDKGALPPGVL